MKSLSLFPGAPATINLGFGTTSFMGLASTKERLTLLNAAFDAGIRHFDTAPYYGFGEAERVLGDFLVGKRDQVTVTTKYGIQPSAVVKARWVNLLARRVCQLFPPLKRALSRRAKALTVKAPFTAAAARQSLDQSLASLKTDHVDLFLLHEPTYADAASGELHQFLEEELKRGRIRAYGCGGEFDVIQQVAAARLPTAQWLQFEDNLFFPTVEKMRQTGARCITFRTFHQALAHLNQWLQANPNACAEWERQLQVNLRIDGNLAGLLQAVAHARNPEGILLFSTRRADRLPAAVEIASGKKFAGEQIAKIEELARPLAAQAMLARRP